VSLPERHPYGPGRGQHGELWLPAGDGVHPVAVLLHGGFWRAQYGRREMDALCADLAGRGWVAWNVEYRRLGRQSGGGFPRTLEDVAAAVDHLADLPAHPLVDVRPVRHRLDLERVVAIGHSAGGQLATWLATRERPRVPVSRVVALAGVVDLRLASELELSGGAADLFLGGSPAQVPERYAAASPAERLPLGVPALLVHGARDEIVPPLMSERFAAAARAAGDDVVHIVCAGAGHMEHLDPAGAPWRAVTAWLDQRP
jgi:acetyl esterase/lipase